MEHIRKAVERTKGRRAADVQPQEHLAATWQPDQLQPNAGAAGAAAAARSFGNPVMLNVARLESRRIISHDTSDPRSRPFDMLRTQVLQSMDMKTWQLLGVTSPTEGCGKSVIAINLALSIARLQERSVVLVDMDLQRPQVATNLGLKCDQGILSVLEGRTSLSNSLVPVRVNNEQLLVLPCEASTQNSSEWIASRSMSAVLHEIKRDFRGSIVIFDLPPILPSDDVISILPQIDCTLFVTAAGTTTVQEIKECNKHLEASPIVRVVLNKATDSTATYYSYSRYNTPMPVKTDKERFSPARSKRRKESYIMRLIDRIVRF